MKKYEKTIKQINEQIKKIENKFLEEERNAPFITINEDDFGQDLTPDDEDIVNGPKAQTFLSIPLIAKALELSDFDLEEMGDSGLFDICEATFIFAHDYGLPHIMSELDKIMFKPSPMLNNLSDLDDMAAEFYQALEQAFEAGF